MGDLANDVIWAALLGWAASTGDVANEVIWTGLGWAIVVFIVVVIAIAYCYRYFYPLLLIYRYRHLYRHGRSPSLALTLSWAVVGSPMGKVANDGTGLNTKIRTPQVQKLASDNLCLPCTKHMRHTTRLFCLRSDSMHRHLSFLVPLHLYISTLSESFCLPLVPCLCVPVCEYPNLFCTDFSSPLV